MKQGIRYTEVYGGRHANLRGRVAGDVKKKGDKGSQELTGGLHRDPEPAPRVGEEAAEVISLEYAAGGTIKVSRIRREVLRKTVTWYLEREAKAAGNPRRVADRPKERARLGMAEQGRFSLSHRHSPTKKSNS